MGAATRTRPASIAPRSGAGDGTPPVEHETRRASPAVREPRTRELLAGVGELLLDELHALDLVLLRAAGALDHGDVALLLADEGPGDGARHGDPALLQIRLQLADDAIGHLVAGVAVLERHRRAEH